MVDRQHLERHYKVEKNESFTTLQPIPANNPYVEEVVYEALGTSIYELIQPNMVVFEGKIDKDLFDAFTKKYARDIKPKKVGTISADGVSKMPTYTKFFDGKMVKGYFLTDSDQEGKNIKKNLTEEGIVKGGIFEINDILDLEKPATVEDLFPAEIIQACVSELFGVSLQLDPKQAFIKQIEQRNREEKGKINDMEALKKKIVEYILSEIATLNKANCRSKYSTYLTFVEELHKKIK
jgi:5S rRNA maturation endonuclease (ribonuclease M5)